MYIYITLDTAQESKWQEGVVCPKVKSVLSAFCLSPITQPARSISIRWIAKALAMSGVSPTPAMTLAMRWKTRNAWRSWRSSSPRDLRGHCARDHVFSPWWDSWENMGNTWDYMIHELDKRINIYIYLFTYQDKIMLTNQHYVALSFMLIFSKQTQMNRDSEPAI